MAAAEVDRSRLPLLATAGALAALLALHVALGLHVRGPLIFDGAAYLANARWLAGHGVTYMGSIGFYHPGWSLLVAPLFWILDSPQSIYEGALLLNAVLASASFLAYVALGRTLGLRPTPAFLAGLVAATYPAVLLQATMEWSESLFQLLMVLLVLALHRLVMRPSTTSAALVGVLVPAMYAVHPRALGILPVVAIGMVVLSARGMLPRRAAVVGVALLVVGFVAVRALNTALLDAMWPAQHPLGEGDILGRITDPQLAWNTVVRAIGQLWYVVVASAGVALAGIWMLVDRLLRRPSPRVTAFAALTLATMAATLGASSLMMADGTRVDHLVYGRYNEGFLPTLLVFGAVGLLRLRTTRDLLVGFAFTVASAAVLALATASFNGGEHFTGGVAPVNVLGILRWSTDAQLHTIDLLRVTVGALAVGAVVLAARRHSVRTALVVLTVFFVASAVEVRHDELVPWSSYWSRVHLVPDAIEALPGAEGVAVSMLRDPYEPQAGDFYQYQLLDRPVRMWDGASPPEQLVIAPIDWPGAAIHDLRLVFREVAQYKAALWAAPGPLRESLERDGFVFGADPLAALPTSALAGTIDGPTTVTMHPGEKLVVPVQVTNTGTGSPWPDSTLADGGPGAVRLTAEWGAGSRASGSGLGDLPHVLLPGQTGTVQLFLTAPRATGVHDVPLRLVQDGVQRFPATTLLVVEVR